ncbi:MAG: hypothetical protein DMG11_16335 [Acidobacteria bacterium]|nr:MAG: hypothetical protein DMG11_16335 [Acidobacteriota bacterium]
MVSRICEDPCQSGKFRNWTSPASQIRNPKSPIGPAINSEPSAVHWIDIALSRGYSDQSHFIHDFREFSGLSPTEYLGLRTEHPGHVQFRD